MVHILFDTSQMSSFRNLVCGMSFEFLWACFSGELGRVFVAIEIHTGSHTVLSSRKHEGKCEVTLISLRSNKKHVLRSKLVHTFKVTQVLFSLYLPFRNCLQTKGPDSLLCCHLCMIGGGGSRHHSSLSVSVD